MVNETPIWNCENEGYSQKLLERKKKKKAVKGEEKILLLYRSEDTWRKEKAYKKKPVSFEATSTKHRWHRTTSLIFQET